MTVEQIKAKAEELEPFLIEFRRDLHRHPEFSMQEVRTSGRVAEVLEEHGIPYRRIGETGIAADITGGKPGPRILLRADMDALSVTEETGLPYASEIPGAMHACGHDCHTAMLLTAGLILQEFREELAGNVRLAFQPAEEIARGAAAMVDGGVLEGVDACFGMHVMPRIPLGKIGYCRGATASAASYFRIDVTGKPGHGSAPQNGIDAIAASASMITSYQTLLSREIDPLKNGVITIGKIEGGDRFNIIPGHVRMEGTARTYCSDVFRHIEELVKRVTASTAEAYRCTAEVDYQNLTDVVENDDDMIDLFLRSSEKILGPDAATETAPFTGSEDFCEYSCRRPSCFVWLGFGDPEADVLYDNHHSRFCVDERALKTGVALHVMTAAEYLAQ